jgi:CheY-like chemotaxis protein
MKTRIMQYEKDDANRDVLLQYLSDNGLSLTARTSLQHLTIARRSSSCRRKSSSITERQS